MKTLEQVNEEVAIYGMRILEYYGALEKAKVICSNNHITMRRYSDIKSGHNCPKCSKNQKIDIGELDIKLSEYCLIRNSKYINKDVPIELVCTKCNSEFNKRLCSIHKNCCPHCRFINNLGDLEGYKWCGKERTKQPDRRFCHILQCPNNHIFKIASNDWKRGNRCNCSISNSLERDVMSELDKIGYQYEFRNRTLLKGYEIDFLVSGVGIEFNGTYWHSSKVGKTKYYHQTKSLMCDKLGIPLMHIHESVWKTNKEMYIDRLLYLISDNNKVDEFEIDLDLGVPKGYKIVKAFKPTLVSNIKYEVYNSGRAIIKKR